MLLGSRYAMLPLMYILVNVNLLVKRNLIFRRLARHVKKNIVYANSSVYLTILLDIDNIFLYSVIEIAVGLWYNKAVK